MNDLALACVKFSCDCSAHLNQLEIYFCILSPFICLFPSWKILELHKNMGDLITCSLLQIAEKIRQVFATIPEESCFLYFCYCACFVFQNHFLSKTNETLLHPFPWGLGFRIAFGMDFPPWLLRDKSRSSILYLHMPICSCKIF